jgi:hypothetical protein
VPQQSATTHKCVKWNKKINVDILFEVYFTFRDRLIGYERLYVTLFIAYRPLRINLGRELEN